jgi:predicted nucleic acid-binding protein
MKDYRGQGAGLVDRIIRLQLMQTADQIITFDRDFARLADVELLQDVQR